MTIFANFPQVFAAVFSAFSIFIPAKTRAKFIIFGTDDREAMFERIRADQVPEIVGGMGYGKTVDGFRFGTEPRISHVRTLAPTKEATGIMATPGR